MNTEPTSILDHCKEIVTRLASQPMDAAFFADARKDLAAVSAVLSASPTQTALFALLLDEYGEGGTSLNIIAEKIKCSKIQFLKYLDDFEALERKHIIRPHREDWESLRARKRNGGGTGLPSYSITMDVIRALRTGEKYRYTPYVNLNPKEFFETADDLFDSLKDNSISVGSLIAELKALIQSNRGIAFVKNIKHISLTGSSVPVLLFFCCALVANNREKLSCKYIRPILVYLGSRVIEKKFRDRDHLLFKTGLIENDCDRGIADTEYFRLTEKAKKIFLADVDLKEKNNRGRNLISAETLKPRELFYSTQTGRRIEELTSLLREENFAPIKQRLTERNLRSGFTCIFSGPPGTGKTETVYNLAHETGRDIMLVDISETKSMWFGESEKRIKELFDRYHGLVKGGGITPILFFNEADAVLGKRQELGEVRRGPAQTENTIQNIILQEMEDLAGGILIATTNMTANLDKAFDRRFLYKIEFEKPNAAAKTAIWKNNIPGLTEDGAAVLAERFDFSGGQIENITRKEAVASLLSGRPLSLEDLIVLCEEEYLEQDSVKIGFCV
ncbi:hypothetical protein AGMMS49944_11550 [Spirochaetia bacterium]|nr:hypothetical protein AGMMS49944_11550 [Spirochaetia bacterium]